MRAAIKRIIQEKNNMTKKTLNAEYTTNNSRGQKQHKHEHNSLKNKKKTLKHYGRLTSDPVSIFRRTATTSSWCATSSTVRGRLKWCKRQNFT